ncbi:hypothetical protein [Rhizobium leguminosarum]|uniref:hypothetical protein n=1 Tax=Rhizobium leguminosarum TaxID=384 RepID=UPI0018D53553|nr:hypothetical protein [Rhizobium leguminosarum]
MIDLAPKFYPVLSSLQRFLKCSPNLGQRELEFSGVMKCSPNLGQRELEFSGVKAQVGGGADEPFMSKIGTLLPIALCGRNSLYNTTTEHPQDGGS